VASLPESPHLTIPALPPTVFTSLFERSSSLRESLADALRVCLCQLGDAWAASGLLQQAEDVFFCYFDELWRLHQTNSQPESLENNILMQRKRRYLADAHAGSPDWKLDQLGFGFNQDNLPHELLMAKVAVTGQAQGRIRRLTSGWMLNQIEPGEILVMHQCDPHWLPWLTQAAGLILADRNPLDSAILLAQWLKIPCFYSLDDAMHCLVDGQKVRLDASTGQVVSL
jgi:phosphohistidine swiveling domain-containing protein